MSLLDHPLIGERYFVPLRAEMSNTYPVPVEGARLACIHQQTAPDGPTMVHFHGNGEIVTDYLPDFAEAVGAMGVNLLLVEYRGYGASTGEPALRTMLDDVMSIVARLGLPPRRLIAFGRSLGSIYAVHMAALFPELAGLILESGIADPLERILLRVQPEELGTTLDELAAEAQAYFNHQAKMQSYPGPVLLLHARNDVVIPLENAEHLRDWATGPVQLVVFEEGDHNTLLALNWWDYLDAIDRFVRELIDG